MSFKDSEFHHEMHWHFCLTSKRHVKSPAPQQSSKVVANAAKKEDIEKAQSLL